MHRKSRFVSFRWVESEYEIYDTYEMMVCNFQPFYSNQKLCGGPINIVRIIEGDLSISPSAHPDTIFSGINPLSTLHLGSCIPIASIHSCTYSHWAACDDDDDEPGRDA
ncbi:hypothetical protein ACRALDRAFT_213363 [Sodiomyces alcalophilus JCM 7366]|uniref:uncharacterized protein n=1 Tax=Sodiomyces alcalophilus JCM 7366 TaxID=591952 RepID=UPI0039B55DAA